jgi:hypothetical protein
VHHPLTTRKSDFYRTKNHDSWHFCKVNYRVSFITIWDVYCDIWYTKNCNLTLGNDTYYTIIHMHHYIISICNFYVLYIITNITYCTLVWTPCIMHGYNFYFTKKFRILIENSHFTLKNHPLKFSSEKKIAK